MNIPAPESQPRPSADGPIGGVAERLARALGADRVVSELDRRVFLSTDISRQGPTIDAAVRPRTVEELSVAIRICADSGVPAIPRGGGFSYTGGYVPQHANSVIVDLRGLDKIVEINAEDMYVVVETGCTWHTLYEALKEKGLRTPYFGPMSGYGATIGGALSQGSFFLGSSQYGPVFDSVLAIEVVLADGSVIRTASWGSKNDVQPFLRSYGPDLTGLFLNDTGAFGFKSKAALKLIPFPQHQQYGSFAFTDERAAINAVSAIGRTGLAGECYCWDPYFVKVMAAASTGLADDLKYLAGVARGGSSVTRGLFNAARLAVAGKSVFDGDIFMLNVTIDDASKSGADEKLRILRALATEAGGKEISPSAPMAMRGTPFTNFNTAERRQPVRNLPTHGLTTHSKLPALAMEVRSLLAERRALMAEHGIECGIIYFGVGVQAVCLEPLLYWEDKQHFNHNRVDERSDLTELAAFQGVPAATTAALAIRSELTALFKRHGCAHVQIGKSYPWLETRQPTVDSLVRSLKDVLDPHGLVNPGALGLGRVEPLSTD